MSVASVKAVPKAPIAVAKAIAPEAIKAAGMLSEARRDIGVLAVTSADRLNAGWTAAQRARARGNHQAKSHVERLLEPLSGNCRLVTVLDGHPATLSWLGSVNGQRVRALGTERFGQTGDLPDTYAEHRLDASAVLDTLGAKVDANS